MNLAVFRLVVIFVISLCNSVIFTFTTYATQNISINSDKLVLDQKSSSITFTDNVELVFQDHILKTNNLVIYYKTLGKKEVIDKIIVNSLLNLYKTDENIYITSDKAEYNSINNEIVFINNVVIKKNGDILMTNEFRYKLP
ncbi:LptA/OstA family protein [Rickettsia endosymbiont of Cardiosporidium cionae]|uniref:LptA/OstA family protein n=1 Tax=Rickettsia endosymbiont of Cardiosporidium cionae TaxID=2777155 RepID=UPI001895DD0E|nr:LptA/OstA family protein [Rickettsia endosymbiont of Cardiosporidium cionae]KAF8818661.1 Lipopolysaccharide export system protein LptA [Rickettsia endosymbiont of Cardiosporidium cionae]